MDCESLSGYDSEPCKKKRLVENCQKFDGKVKGNVCMVGKFPMSRSDFAFGFKPHSQEHIHMSPKEFLRLAPETHFNRKNIEDLKEKIKNKEMDVLFLDVDIDKCKVLAHEGRNRAKASEELGLSKVPVVIFKKEFDEEARGMFGSRGFHVDSREKMHCDGFHEQ